MYQVLIADDEKIIRKGLMNIVPWNDLGYEICGEAANGKEALAFIEENNPDLVMIDIKMPGLKGLEVIKKVREDGYTGKIIILSGFADFSYAQEAIGLGVTSYLTKPVDKELLTKYLVDIAKELDENSKVKEEKELLSMHTRDSLLTELLTGGLPGNEQVSNELKLSDDAYQVIVFEKYSRDVLDLSYNFYEILKVTGESKENYDYLVIHNYNVLLLKGGGIIARFQKILDKYDAKQKPEKNSPLDTIFFACGEQVEEIGKLKNSFEQAKKLIKRRFFLEKERHYATAELDGSLDEFSEETQDVDIASYVENIVGCIKTFNRNKLSDTLEELREAYIFSHLEVVEQKNQIIDMYLQIKEKISIVYRTVEIPFVSNQEAIRTILESYSLQEIIEYIMAQFEMMMSATGFSSRDSIIDSIIHYIDHNYSENISLESIAPKFGYNSSYLGKILSKKIGVNFNTYLDQIRVGHAKELLIKEKYQVYKIAELVGYSNVDYFHIKFKKSTGMSPAEFRKKYREESEG